MLTPWKPETEIDVLLQHVIVLHGLVEENGVAEFKNNKFKDVTPTINVRCTSDEPTVDASADNSRKHLCLTQIIEPKPLHELPNGQCWVRQSSLITPSSKAYNTYNITIDAIDRDCQNEGGASTAATIENGPQLNKQLYLRQIKEVKECCTALGGNSLSSQNLNQMNTYDCESTSK